MKGVRAQTSTWRGPRIGCFKKKAQYDSESYAARMGICSQIVKGFEYLWEAGVQEVKRCF